MLINISVGDVFSVVRTKEAIPIVKLVCRAKPSGFQFMPRYKNKMWDGYISLMNGFSKFPTGLLHLVIDAIEAAGHTVHISNDSRIGMPAATVIAPDMLVDITLRDYQIKATEQLLLERRGIAKMATNSGKTEIIAAIIKALHKKTVVLVHRKELLHQTSKRIYDRTGMNVGVIGDGIEDPQFVTVCMIQTLSNKFKLYKRYLEDNVVVIIDECHHASSSQMMDVLFKLPGCYRFGFSGTPLKNDNLADLKLMAVTGKVVYELGNAAMISAGWSAKPVVKLHVIDKNAIYDADYTQAYAELVVGNVQRNRIISEISKNAIGVVLVLVNRLEHGDILHNMIPGSTFVHGSKSTEFRMNVLDRMAKEAGVYIATSIFDEGIDVPAIDVVVLAAGGKSNVTLLQRIGRGLRKKVGNNTLVVHDFIDDTNKYLFRHTEARVKVYVHEGFEKEIVK